MDCFLKPLSLVFPLLFKTSFDFHKTLRWISCILFTRDCHIYHILSLNFISIFYNCTAFSAKESLGFSLKFMTLSSINMIWCVICQMFIFLSLLYGFSFLIVLRLFNIIPPPPLYCTCTCKYSSLVLFLFFVFFISSHLSF